MAVISGKSFEIVTPETRKKKGPLVKVEIRPGQFRKMYQADAVEAGLIAPAKKTIHEGHEGSEGNEEGEKGKRREGEGNKALETKMRPAREDKGVSVETASSSKTSPRGSADGTLPSLPKAERGAEGDLTGIPGVGRATVRLLATRGVTTTVQLRQAVAAGALGDMGLSASVQAAIELWAKGEEVTDG